MGRVFRPSNCEAKILSKIESSKERALRFAIEQLRDVAEPLSNSIAMSFIQEKLVETKNKDDIQEQIAGSLQKLTRADEFDIDYQIAPIRHLVPYANVISLYLTSFVVEQLINHRSVEDIYGSDEQIYQCINIQVAKYVR